MNLLWWICGTLVVAAVEEGYVGCLMRACHDRHSSLLRQRHDQALPVVEIGAPPSSAHSDHAREVLCQ